MTSIFLNLLSLISLLILGTADCYKIEILGNNGNLFIFFLSFVVSLSIVLSISNRIFISKHLVYLDLLFKFLNVCFLGGLCILSYKLWLLESWNSQSNSLVLGIFGLKITRIWNDSEKLSMINHFWSEKAKELTYEMLIKYKELIPDVTLSDKSISSLLSLSSPYEIKTAISVLFSSIRKQKIEEFSESSTWNHILWSLYSFITSPLGLALVGMGAILIYYSNMSWLNWYFVDHKNEALQNIHSGVENLGEATSLLNQRVDGVAKVMVREGLALKSEVQEVRRNYAEGLDAVANALLATNHKLDTVTSVLTEEEKAVGLLSKLLEKKELYKLGVDILFDNNVLADLEVLKKIQESGMFGESFFNALANLLSEHGYAKNEFSQVSKESFPGVGRVLRDSNE